MRTNARVKSYAIDNSLAIQAFHLGIGIKFVEVTNTQSQIGVGKEFNSLSFLHSHKERVNVLLNSSFLQEGSKGLSSLFEHFYIGHCCYCCIPSLKFWVINNLRIPYNDTTWVKVVIKSLALTQKFGREEKVELLHATLCILDVKTARIAYRNGTLNHHYGIRIYFKHEVYHLFYVTRIEVISDRVIVSRSGYYHEVGISISCTAIERSRKIKFLFSQILLNIFVLNGRDAMVEFLHLFGYYIYCRHLMVLR